MSISIPSAEAQHLLSLSLFAFSLLFDNVVSRRVFSRLHNELSLRFDGKSNKDCKYITFSFKYESNLKIDSLFTKFFNCILFQIFISFMVLFLEFYNVMNFGFNFVSVLLLIFTVIFLYVDIKGIYTLHSFNRRFP